MEKKTFGRINKPAEGEDYCLRIIIYGFAIEIKEFGIELCRKLIDLLSIV